MSSCMTKTGLFKGSFEMYYDGFGTNSSLKSNTFSVPYSGVMMPDGGRLTGIGVGTLTINKQKIPVPVFLD